MIESNNTAAISSVIYLHGFASGPSSAKAAFFSQRLRASGFDVCVPDLNKPSFERMTISSQLETINREIDQRSDRQILIVGSSMGGLLAVLSAMDRPCVRALMLMAPGFGLTKRWDRLISAEAFARWQAERTIEFYHYAYNEYRQLSYSFVEDFEKHQTEGLSVSVPTLVFHGMRDETVPSAESIQFRDCNREMVELHLVDDDHQLLESLETIWGSMLEFSCRHGLAEISAKRA